MSGPALPIATAGLEFLEVQIDTLGPEKLLPESP